MTHFLGIDIGTSGTKTGLFTDDGALVDTASCGYELQYPRPGWVEQNPQDWWDALVRTVRTVVTRNDCASTVASLSLSTQAGSLVLLDRTGAPMRPAVTWLDRRAASSADELGALVGRAEVYRATGWDELSGLAMPSAFHLSRTTPELFRRASYLATTADYLHLRLTGRFALDATNSALTEFLDLESGDVWDTALEAVGVPRRMLPEVVPAGTSLGGLTPAAQAALGLDAGVIVVAGAHDQYCAALGAGATTVGECVLSAGTAWVLLAVSGEPVFDRRPVNDSDAAAVLHPGPHIVANLFGVMTAISFGGNSLAWFRRTLGCGRSFSELDAAAAETVAGASGLLFVPPLVSQSGAGAFLHIDGAHTLGHFVRAIYEGVALVARRHLERMRDAGVAVDRVRMIGGGAAGRVWPQVVADMLGRPVHVSSVDEAACVGAGILAAVGSGRLSSVSAGVERFCSSATRVVPDHDLRPVYDELSALSESYSRSW